MIPATTALTVINKSIKLVETMPTIVNAANHVLTNGIRQGGFDIISTAWQGIANSGGVSSVGDIGRSAFQGMQGQFGANSQGLFKDVTALGQNIKNRFVAPKAMPTKPQLGATDAFNATDTLNHGITETATGAASMLSSVGSAAAKGGIAGIVLGITTETLASYEKYKNGKMSKEEYVSEIAKSGGQMGITGAATAGIMTALSVPLGAAGLATAPITVPVSIVLGSAIDKIVAPAFGRGEYKKILDEAKYYQNLIYAHDDLVAAIEATENQFAEFIDEYQRQLKVHAQLTDTNAQINQLHTVANNQLQQQAGQLNNTFGTLGDLYSKI